MPPSPRKKTKSTGGALKTIYIYIYIYMKVTANPKNPLKVAELNMTCLQCVQVAFQVRQIQHGVHFKIRCTKTCPSNGEEYFGDPSNGNGDVNDLLFRYPKSKMACNSGPGRKGVLPKKRRNEKPVESQSTTRTLEPAGATFGLSAKEEPSAAVYCLLGVELASSLETLFIWD